MSIFRGIKPPILILLMSEVLLVLVFPLSLIFEPTVTAGGDTPSHFISAIAMSRGLKAFFCPVTWIHGAYGGFPLFLQYFPLPFAMMAVISLAASLQVSFKIVTLLAVLPLPAAVYFCLRRLRYPQNTAAVGAALTLPFLFLTANSVWGGNILSTLAGEFSFGIALIFYVILTGKIFDDMARGKPPLGSCVLEALVALGSGYPLLQSAMGTSYFLVRGRGVRYIIRLHLMAFCLAAFWLLPLVWRLPWNTPFSHTWKIESWTEIAPPLLWPSFVGVLILLLPGLRALLRGREGFRTLLKSPLDGPEPYLFWHLAAALLAFSVAPSAGLVDIRFLPFAQIMAVLLGAVGWGRVLSGVSRPNFWTALFCIAIAGVALTRVHFIDSWLQWNYTGMESKPLWNSYSRLNEYLSGDPNSPRVVYEHDDITNSVGTVRAFELLPCFSGRSTLEGLYLQSSPSSPFVFYIQSELTQNPSAPFPRYYYSRPDPARAAAHLRLFNVSQVIAATLDMANALDYSPDYAPAVSFPPYMIYRVRACPDSYVEPLRFKPLRIPPRDWKKVQFEWFRKSSLRVPLVIASEGSNGTFWRELAPYGGSPADIPEEPFDAPPAGVSVDREVKASAVLGDGRITIDTSKPGHPLWIKVSYHPDWRISEGQGELYPASPAFMLLVPATSRVVLTFDTGSGVYLAGKILSAAAAAILVLLPVFSAYRRRRGPGKRPGKDAGGAPETVSSPACSPGTGANVLFFLLLVTIAAVVTAGVWTRNHRDPILLYGLVTGSLEKMNLDSPSPNPPEVFDSPEAAHVLDLLDECTSKFGHSAVMDHCVFYKAYLMAARGKWDELQTMLEDFLRENPDNRIYSECLRWLGEASLKLGRKDDAESYFRRSLFCWPANNASKQAGLRLAEMNGSAPLLEEAQKSLTSGRYLEAYEIYTALTLSQDKKVRAESMLALGYCSFYMNRTEEASNLFLQWLSENFESPGSERVQADLKECRSIIAKNREWMEARGRGQPSPPAGGPLRVISNGAK